MKDKATIGVVGAGVMGRGIVQLFAQAGHRVLLTDNRSGAAEAAEAFVEKMIRRQVDKEKITIGEAEDALNRVEPVDDIESLAPCDVIIEAVVENLEIKQALFRDIEYLVGEDVILASNTSSLLVSAIASGCRHPGRVAGLHFFNPVPLMKVVEVIPAVRTEPEVVERLRSMVSQSGHRAVVAQDQPGFLINHAGRGLNTEGLKILEERVATVEDIDRILRDAVGFRMGPFELMDLTGLDVSGKVMESVFEQFHQDPRYRPSSLVAPRVAAGLFGRKTKRGFYRYEDGQPLSAPEHQPGPPQPAGFWVAPSPEQGRRQVIELLENAGGRFQEQPSEDCILLVRPWGGDVSSESAGRGLDPARCVGLDPLPELGLRRTLMTSPAADPDIVDRAHRLLAADGVPVSIIQDSPGFVCQRVLAVIVNIACEIAQRGIASPADIDDAVRLGLGYPRGPLAWGDLIGPGRVLEILERIQQLTGDPRYRPTSWLRRRAQLGLSLTQA
ncbi:MAG: 3-hydroxyacyl-CoA dehydrogenase [Xanthomonadales bacterium]|nr:3-hydroxyacyl-CoA dehydrogenase [Xanthomonadales bacterium]